MRGDRPFAYDLVIEYGAVSGRVALLLRSAEAKLRFFTSVPMDSPFIGLVYELLEGVLQYIIDLIDLVIEYTAAQGSYKAFSPHHSSSLWQPASGSVRPRLKEAGTTKRNRNIRSRHHEVTLLETLVSQLNALFQSS
jgi:hypothetical protein